MNSLNCCLGFACLFLFAVSFAFDVVKMKASFVSQIFVVALEKCGV